MPSIAIAHTDERHRTFERVLSLVKEAVGHLGGIDAFVKPGQTVLIKPSQSVFCASDEASTTDPLVVGALIRLLRLAGARRVQVADSGEGPFEALQCARSGMAEVAEREGADLIDLSGEDVENREIDLPEGRVLHRVPLPVPLLDADVVIAVPKAKNGAMDVISGAMELWMGLVNEDWRAHHVGDRETIGRFADIMTFLRPDLCVTDALICGEGDGPFANLPHWCGCILASADPVANDVAIARLMGRDWKALKFAQEGEERGVGSRLPLVWLGGVMERFAFQAWPGRQGHAYLPVNLLAGEGANLSGTYGQIKSGLDLLLRRGLLEQVIRRNGTPTIMVGEVDDPDFERHLEEGPYLVFDDTAKPKYQEDPRVLFVPTEAARRAAIPLLMRSLGVNLSGKHARVEEALRPGARSRMETAAPSLLTAIAAGTALSIRTLAGKRSNGREVYGPGIPAAPLR